MKNHWTGLALIALIATGCGNDAPIETSLELTGFPASDVQQIVARDDTGYNSREAELQSVQQVALGWSACRDIYDVYQKWTETGVLPAAPTPHPVTEELGGSLGATTAWIEILYSPMRNGDEATAREQLQNDSGCGTVPVAADNPGVLISTELGAA